MRNHAHMLQGPIQTHESLLMLSHGSQNQEADRLPHPVAVKVNILDHRDFAPWKPQQRTRALMM